LVDGSYSLQQQRSSLELKTGYVNPGETFSLQMLIEPSEAQIDEPQVSIRSKGVNAIPRPKQERSVSPGTLFIAAAATLVVMMAMTLWLQLIMRRNLAESSNSPPDPPLDQRDVFAYVLGAHKMYAEADRVRHLEHATYWGQADYLAEQCIGGGDPNKTRAGISCLKNLLDYEPDIAETSKLIIHYNIARMAASVSDNETVRAHLAFTKHQENPLLKKRVAADQSLSRLDTE